MLGASTINAVFAIFAGLWLSRQFYKNITRGGRSKRAELSRTLFLISWGFAVLCIRFAFYSATALLPYVNHILAWNLSQPLGVVLSLLHPFTFGLIVSSLVYPSLLTWAGLGAGGAVLTALTYAVTIGYAGAAILAVTRVTRMTSRITHGQGVAVIRETAKEFTLKLRRPLLAYMTKDVRIATKNPSMAFLVAAPIFVAVVIVISLSQNTRMQIFDFALMTVIGSTFALSAGLLLLNTESKGLQYILAQPIEWSVIINSKTLIATLIFLPVPIVLLLEQFAKSGTWSIPSLVPFVEILAISAATTAEILILGAGSRIATSNNLSRLLIFILAGFTLCLRNPPVSAGFPDPTLAEWSKLSL
jgi:predicted permease